MKNKFLIWALAGIAALGAIATWYYPRVDQFSDIFFYEKIAQDVASIRAGGGPGEPSAWYPPFASAIFYGISLIPSFSFVQIWLGFLVAAIAAATVYLYFGLKIQRAYLLPCAIILCFFILGNNVTLARYDILIGLCIILAYFAHRTGRYASSIVWVMCAGGLKAVPFILLPLILLMIPRAHMRSMAIGFVIGLTLVAGIPAALIGPKHSLDVTRAFTSFQGERGFQIESAWSGVDMLIRNVLDQKAYAVFHHFATHNMDLGTTSLKVVTILLAASLLLLYWHVWKHPKRSELDLALVFAACISLTLFIAPVLSPQFLLWLIPLLVIWIGIHTENIWKISSRVRWVVAATLFISLATHWIYPWHYREFFEQTYMFNIVVLNTRNLALAFLAVVSLGAIGVRVPTVVRAFWKRIATFFIQETATLTSSQKKIAAWAMVVVAALFIGYICSFSILDRDFWWHIKAGEIMTETKSLISVEPFAYTREGQPYLATQSYLAEIALYAIHAVFGVNGIIVFRTLAMLVVFGLLLLVDKKHAWLTSLLVILAANAAQPAFIERPQLFTFILFALFVFLAFRTLEKGLSQHIALAFIGLEVLWVNMHGAAAFLGIFVVVSLALQRWYVQREVFIWKPWAYLGAGMALAFFLSPSGYSNGIYMFQLLSDKTIVFIEEWQPRPLPLYLGELGIFWIAALWSMWRARRNWVFSSLLLVGIGFLSLRAMRHEVLFVIAAVGITIYQLAHAKGFARFAQYLARRQMLAGTLLIVSIFGLFLYTKNHYQNFVQQDQLYGYGVFTPAKGAYEFVEKNNLTGNMFNTYGIGGYLLNRGYPDRKVYIDGRNVDYGYEFMNEMYEAGLDAEHWKIIEDKYDLSYAVIDYMAIAKVGRAGYSAHLDKNESWKLVHLDDWTGVYVKNIPEYAPLIDANAYKLLTPINIDKGAVLDEMTAENKAAVMRELERAIAGNSDGVKARILLARIYISDGIFEKGKILLDEVRRVQSHLADTYQLLGTIAIAQQQWVEAAGYYDQMLNRTGKAYPQINYRAVADVYEKAGHPLKAAFYRFLAMPDIQTKQHDNKGVIGESSIQEGSGPVSQETIGNLFAGIAEDLTKYNDEGAALGEQGKFPEARGKFMEALKLDPGNPQTLNNLGVLSLQTGDEKAAMDYFKRALERTDEYPDVHYNLAILYYRQKNYIEAQKEAEKAQKYGRDVRSLLDAIRAKSN